MGSAARRRCRSASARDETERGATNQVGRIAALLSAVSDMPIAIARDQFVLPGCRPGSADHFQPRERERQQAREEQDPEDEPELPEFRAADVSTWVPTCQASPSRPPERRRSVQIFGRRTAVDLPAWLLSRRCSSFLLMVVSGWIHRHQLTVIEFLQAENRLLKEKLGGKRDLHWSGIVTPRGSRMR